MTSGGRLIELGLKAPKRKGRVEAMTADKISDRADLAAERVWVEMDEFLAWCEAEGAPKTTDEKTKRDKRYLEIQERINARWREIYRRASSSD